MKDSLLMMFTMVTVDSFTVMGITILGNGLMESGVDLESQQIKQAGFTKANGSIANLWDLEACSKMHKIINYLDYKIQVLNKIFNFFNI